MHYPVQGDPYVTFWLKKVPLYLPPKKNRPAAPTLSRPTPPTRSPHTGGTTLHGARAHPKGDDTLRGDAPTVVLGNLGIPHPRGIHCSPLAGTCGDDHLPELQGRRCGHHSVP